MTDKNEPGVSRREVVKGTGATAFALAAATWSAAPSLAANGQMVTGIVFEDRSHAGHRQPGDPGLAGVLVSNGTRDRQDRRGRPLRLADRRGHGGLRDQAHGICGAR